MDVLTNQYKERFKTRNSKYRSRFSIGEISNSQNLKPKEGEIEIEIEKIMRGLPDI